MTYLDIFFDVDGTLEGFDGVVTSTLCKQLKKQGARLWMLSRRDTEEEADQIIEKFGFTQCKMQSGKNYIEIKSRTLERYINLQLVDTSCGVVYVGDRIDDFLVAMKTCVVYCRPENLSLDIFNEAKKGLIAIL